MPGISLTASLKAEYQQLFDNCNIRTERLSEIDSIIQKIISNKTRYESVGDQLNIPWYVIASIHNMESSLNFNCHLHNGEPLTARTRNVPAGRPLIGNPPFTWEASAIDSLQLQRLDTWRYWLIPGILYKIEEYNGWGYRRRHPEILSPYLWSGSYYYSKGKYVADGRWSDNVSSDQIGAGLIIRRLAEKNLISLERFFSDDSNKPMVYYSTRKIEYGEQLQKFLNLFPGIYLLVDGKPAEKTSNAFKLITGNYLNGDPRL